MPFLFKKAKAIIFASTLNSTVLLLIPTVSSESQIFNSRITYTYAYQRSMARFNLSNINAKFKLNLHNAVTSIAQMKNQDYYCHGRLYAWASFVFYYEQS